MKTQATSYDWYCAYVAANQLNFVPLAEDETINGAQLVQPCEQERRCIIKELIDLLPLDAKSIMDIILDSPEEVYQAICTPITLQPSKRLLKLYLRKIGWRNRRITKSFNDLKKFVNVL